MTWANDKMQRVMVVGGPGSGKSTLARVLGNRTGLPVHHVDQIIWAPGWVMRSTEESAPIARDVEAKEQWVIDGFLTETWPTRAARADTLIWLDLPIGLRLWRTVKRLIQNFGRVRPDMADGCPEQVSGEFIGFLWWMWQTRTSQREEFEILIAEHPHLTVHHLRSRTAVVQFLKEVT